MACEKFSQFSKLPPEVRELVWKAAMPPPRILRVMLEDDPPHFLEHGDILDGVHCSEVLEGGEILKLYEIDTCADLYGEYSKRFKVSNFLSRTHITSVSLSGNERSQTQLQQFGFTSRVPQPVIRHVPPSQAAEQYSIDIPMRNTRSTDPHLTSTPRIVPRTWISKWKPNQVQGLNSWRLNPTIGHLTVGQIQEILEKTNIQTDILSIPQLLHVCRESRGAMMRFGYELGFSSRWATTESWFNFRTDFLFLLPDYDWEYSVPLFTHDRNRVRNLALGRWSLQKPGVLRMFLAQFVNLSELAVIAMDEDGLFYDTKPDDWILIDCTHNEIIERCSFWLECMRDNPSESYTFNYTFHPNEVDDIGDTMEFYDKGIPLFQELNKTLEAELKAYSDQMRETGHPEWRPPRVRLVVLTTESIEKEYQSYTAAQKAIQQQLGEGRSQRLGLSQVTRN